MHLQVYLNTHWKGLDVESEYGYNTSMANIEWIKSGWVAIKTQIRIQNPEHLSLIVSEQRCSIKEVLSQMLIMQLQVGTSTNLLPSEMTTSSWVEEPTLV